MMIPITAYPEKAQSMSDLISRLPKAADRLQAALVGLSVDDWHALPFTGKWSIRQCAEHILSAALGWTDMCYQAIEDEYTTPRNKDINWRDSYLAAAEGDIYAIPAVFLQHNIALASFLTSLPESDFARGFKPVAFLTEPFQISESINWGVVIHCDHHLATIEKNRKALGKPLPWLEVYLERYPKP